MGDRYYLTVQCPVCKMEEDDVYYAPTCGFASWTCPKCAAKVDLEELTGITYNDASNLELIKQLIGGKK